MKKILIALALCFSVTTASVFAANFGVCTHMGQGVYYDNSSNIQAAKDVKVGWIRDECLWQGMQSDPNSPFQIREKDLDYIKKADEAGMNQLLVLAYGNPSYGVDSNTVFPKQSNATYYKGYLDYVRYTVGQVKDYVDAYEIWNEPNIATFNYELLANGTDYAKLYLDAKAIIDELDPTATVLCGAVTGAESEPIKFGKEIFDHIKTQGDVNDLIDAFSIHYYTQLDDELYYNGLNTWENVFDSYGYTGDVWMTENGVTARHPDISACSETTQAAMVAKLGIQWERYLKGNNRTGVSFWYDLRNDVGVSTYEANFGLVDSSYDIKPSGKAMKTYNRLTEDKNFVGVTQTNSGYVAEYSNDKEKTYIVYNSQITGRTATVPLSGDIVYVYDDLGNVTETITNPSGTKSIPMSSTPVYVECAAYVSTISNVSYDTNENVMNVSGKFGVGDSVTIELLDEDGDVVQTENFAVYDGYYDAWFSVDSSGDFTVRVAKPEIEALERTTGWAEKNIKVKRLADENTQILAGTVVNFDSQSRKVLVSGSVTDYVEEPNVTILVVPDGTDLTDLNPDSVGYMKQSKTKNGLFSFEFTLPKWYEGEVDIYLSGTGIENKQDNGLSMGDNEYAYVASLDLSTKLNITATAGVKNFGESDKTFYMIVAEYKDNMLAGIKIEQKTVPGKTYTTLQAKITDDTISDGSTYAKAFVWNDVTGMVPLIDSRSEVIIE